MATRVFASLTLACVAISLIAGRAQQQQPAFRGTNETVRVYVTVIDRDGKLVTTLTKDKFEIKDDGKLQPITVFDNSPQPIQLIVMLDVSGSMAGNLGLLRAASAQLFGELGPDDVARVGTFGKEVTISPEFTNNRRTLEAALPEGIDEQAPTPLWRGVDKAMDEFDDKSDRRRVVLVLSDGKDFDAGFRRRVVTQVDVIDRARADEVMIYGIGLRSRSNGPPQPMGIGQAALSNALLADMPDVGLARTADESGGGYTEVRPRDDLGAAFARIARELHSQYLLGYEAPKRDGKKHKIDVRVTAGGLDPRARKTYVAPKSTP